MKKILLIATVFGVAVISSCKKDTTQADITATTGISSVQVPTGFNWASTRSLNVTAKITDDRFGATAVHRITIFDGDPYNGGTLLAAGSATESAPFTTNITIPTALANIYVVKTSADKSQIIQKQAVGTSDITLTFGSIDPSVTAEKTAAGKLQTLGGVTPASPDCNSGCTTTISSNTNNVTVNAGDVICITGTNVNVSFASVNGGTVRVCGTNISLQNYNFQNGSSIVVTTNGSLNLGTVNFNSSTSTLSNWGTVNYSGSFPDNGIVNNYGTMKVSGDFNVNSNAGSLTNNGTLTISGSFNNGSAASATNNGSMVVTGAFQQNGGSGVFVNNCSLLVTGNFNQSSAVKNYGYIKVTGTTTINSSTTLNLYNGAMVNTNKFVLDGSTVAGNGSTSLIEINGSTNIQNSGANITGPVSVCAGTNISSTYLKNGAANDCNVYIPVTGCNAEGNGTLTIKDTDGDGVPDDLDAFPNDATKAYISSGGIGTVAFEDQWPNKGDFDMNDLVMNYHYYVITNAANVVVQVTAKFNLLATGGNLGNGFGVQFPIPASSVSGLTTTLAGGALESGQTNAVVTLFPNMRLLMAHWNTQPGVVQSATVADSISFNVSNGPSLTAFGQNGYNPFTWNMGNDNKRREVHLMGQAPTTLANTTLFGTGNDNTNVAAGRYYVTTTGLPYAINIPTTFSYPIEGTDITTVYLHLADWAQSGGISYTDWYSNIATGYRNTSLIYTH